MALEDRKRLPALEEGELKRGISHDLTSSPKLDRYKLAKQLTEKAIKEKKIFSICGHYPVVRAALQRRGWVEKKLQFLPKAAASAEDGGDGPAESKRAEGKKAQEEALGKSEDIRKVMARLVRNEMPYFLWTIRRDIIDCHSLHCEQMLNHYGKTASFTTKIGLCLNLRSLPWCTQADPDTFFPRCYSLCTASDKQAFLDDFRLTMACSILKWVVSHQNCGGSTARNGREEAAGRDPHRKTGPENADSELTGFPEQLVDMACRVCQDALGQLEHEDVGVPEDTAKLLTEDEWEDLTQHYYSLVRGDAYISNSRNHFSRCQALLHKISSVNPQTEIDGLQNIWIVKPAAKSRGRDIVCMNRVEEILELEAPGHLSARDKWVVQKYIETPLLIYDTKFDIRQWFLVTDWNPLTIWFYKESYLRFSTQRFSLDSLDSAIHLCNNSIQRHLKNDAGRSPLLPQYNMWTSSQFREYLQQRGQGSAWSGIIYPSMKQAVADTVHVAQGRVEPRRNSFELYGADFVLGRDFRPWLIEINSSPTMHASTPVTAQLCAQVQEDVIRVVVGRRDGRCCDVGNFELLWRQPTVGLPPSCGSELRVEGVGMRKANKQMLPVSSFNFPSSLSDMQPPKGRCSLAAPGLAPGPPQMAPQQDLKLRNAKVLMCSLPRPLKRPVARGCQVQSTHAETDGDLELPAGDVQPADNKPSKAGLPKGGSDGHVEPNELKEHPQPSMLPSAATVEGALPRPPRPSGLPGDVPTPPCPVCCSSLPPSRPCKRCRSFCAAILQGASFVPLDGPSGPRIPGRRGPGPDQRAQPASAACVSGSYT